MVNRRQVLIGMGGIATVGLAGKVAAAEHCVDLNTAEPEELETLRHVPDNITVDEIIEARPIKNVGDLIDATFWWDPRMLAEFVSDEHGGAAVCEFEVAPVQEVCSLRPPYPRIKGVNYTQGRVKARHIEGEGTEDIWDVGDEAVFAGFRRGGTTVADFTTLSTDDMKANAVWPTWQDDPTRVVMMPLRELP